MYLNYDLQKISKDEYEELRKSRSTMSQRYKTDTLKVFKVSLRHRFGKLDSLKLHQIKTYINSKSPKKISETNYILIANIDTLYNYDAYVKTFVETHPYRPKYHSKEEVSVFQNKKFIKKRFMMNEKKFMKSEIELLARNIKCKKRIEDDYNVKVYHIHSANHKSEPLPTELDWIDDRGVFRNMFFPFEGGNKTIIIKPDGSYFVTAYFNNMLEKALFKNNDWTKFENQLLDIYERNPFYEKQGIFYSTKLNNCFSR